MKIRQRRCTLVLPGLLDLPSVECQQAFAESEPLPELERLFSRARCEPVACAGLEATLFHLFGIQGVSHQDLPLAAASYRADSGVAAQGWCVRADPVHLLPDRDQLVLLGPEALALGLGEAQSLVHELNALFAADGWRFEAPVADRWYLHVPQAPALRTYNLSRVRGQGIGEFLPLGDDGRRWQGVMNEVQMLLHASGVNHTRQAAGKPGVSSVWFWGGGILSADMLQVLRVWNRVYSSEVLASGLALVSDMPCAAMPANGEDWLQSAAAEGDYLLVLDDLQREWQANGLQVWQQILSRVQAQWIRPLLAALTAGELAELSLYSCDGRRFVLGARELRRWWRRRRALGVFCHR